MKALLAAIVLFLPAAALAETAPNTLLENICAKPAWAGPAEVRDGAMLSWIGHDDGHISNVEIATSSGSPRMDEYIVQCVSAWRFNPASSLKQFELGVHQSRFAWTDAAGRMVGLPHTCDTYYRKGLLAPGTRVVARVGFTITSEGRTADPMIERTTGYAELDSATLECVKHWRYRPAIKDGKPVAAPWRAEVAWREDLPPEPAPTE